MDDELANWLDIYDAAFGGEVPRVGTAIPDRCSRLKAIGNGQVHMVFRLAVDILCNEKYIGKIIYGKSFTKIDGREKKVVINNGEQPKYIINNHHEPIIDIETFNRVQSMFKQKKVKRAKTEKTDYSNYEKFAYSLRHDTYLKRKQKGVVDDIDSEPTPYFCKSNVPAFYVKHTSKVLFRSLNALSRKFGRMEALFDIQVDDILSLVILRRQIQFFSTKLPPAQIYRSS
jgi:hypothetical protein